MGGDEKNCRRVRYLSGSVSTLDRITVTVSAEQHNYEYAYRCLMHTKFPPCCCFRRSVTINNSIKQEPAILLNISIRHTDRSFISVFILNPLNAELNPICYLLALLGAHHFLHVSRIRVKALTFRLLMSYIYIYIYIWSTHS